MVVPKADGGGEHELSDLQLRLLSALWEYGELSVAEVHIGLQRDYPLAVTTVATLLSRLHDRGVVDRRKEGRQFLYTAAVEQQAVRKSMVGRLMERLFAGDATELVSHLVEEGALAPAELAELKKRVAKARKKGGSNA